MIEPQPVSGAHPVVLSEEQEARMVEQIARRVAELLAASESPKAPRQVWQREQEVIDGRSIEADVDAVLAVWKAGVAAAPGGRKVTATPAVRKRAFQVLADRTATVPNTVELVSEVLRFGFARPFHAGAMIQSFPTAQAYRRMLVDCKGGSRPMGREAAPSSVALGARMDRS